MTNLPHSITEARSLLDAKKISAVELASMCLENVRVRDKELHAFLEVFDDVREQAANADARIAQGERAPLLGIPFAIKDNILIKGRRAGAASKILEGYHASYDATAIAKLKQAGAVFIGRTNQDEFAMGSSTENSAYGPTKNPHDPTRVPGGSSGGSAAAVAAGFALAALGSDTGGSIRQPAAFCGVVGLKPTYGSVSRSGLIAMGSSLDVIGPLTTTVADAETVFRVVRGHDPLDSTTSPDAWHKEVPAKTSYTIGVPRAFLEKGVEDDVLAAFEETLATLASAGHRVVTIDLPTLPFSLPAYYVIMPAEVSSNLARFDGVRYGLHVDGVNHIDDYKKTRGAGFGPEPRRRVLLGTYVLSAGYYDAFYGKAMIARKKITADLTEAFTSVDVIATPTTPSPAFALGEKTSDPLAMYLEDVFTVSANIAGVPALSVPMGTVLREKKELPVGFQLMAMHRHEDTLIRVGSLIEAARA